MSRDFWITVRGERATDFLTVFGTATVPVQAPVPEPAGLPGFDEPQLVYLLDLRWVVEEGHWEKLVDFTTARFGESREFVDRELADVGMPILARDTILRIDNPARWIA